MVDLELSVAGLSGAALLDLVRSGDPVGVVDGASGAPDGGAAIEVDNRLWELERNMLQLINVGRPAGVVLICARSADLLDWRWGDLRRIAHVRARPAFPYGARPGPVVTNTGPAERATPMRDQRARRDRAHRGQFIKQVAAEAVRLAGERGWVRLVIAGEQQLTRALADALPTRLHENTLLGSRHLTGPVRALPRRAHLVSLSNTPRGSNQPHLHAPTVHTEPPRR